MPLVEICRQGLPHHAVAVVAASDTEMLLQVTGETLEPTAFGHLPRGSAREDFAEKLLGHLPARGNLVELGAIFPHEAACGAVVTVYVASFSRAMLSAIAGNNLELIMRKSVFQLADLHGPVLRLVMASFREQFLVL